MERFFFALVRSGLHQTPIDPAELPADPDWEAVLKMAKKQTLIGIVADAISRLPMERQPSEAVMAKLQMAMARQARSHALLNSTLAKVLAFYRSQGFNPVLLKGQGNALTYPNPLLRTCGDIDFYFGPKAYERACEVSRPLVTDDGPVEEEESIKHYHFSHGQVKIEVHRIAAFMFNFALRRSFASWVERELDAELNPSLRHATIGGADVLLPSAQFNAFYLFYHAWFHFLTGGIGLRQICDWGLHLQSCRGQIDPEALLATVKRYGLLRGWRAFASIAVEQLGFAPEAVPGYQPGADAHKQEVLQSVMRGGNFGYYDPNYIGASDVRRLPLVKRKLKILSRFSRHQLRNFRIAPAEVASHFVHTVWLSGWRTLKLMVKGDD